MQKNELADTISLAEKLMGPKELDAPIGNNCPKCNTLLKAIYWGVMAQWPSVVKCPKCDYQETGYGYLGKKLISVESLPEYGKVTAETGTLKVPNYQNKSDKGEVSMTDSCKCQCGCETKCESTVVVTQVKECCIKSGGKCGCSGNKSPSPSQIRKETLKKYLAKYNEQDLRFMYFRSAKHPTIIISAVSKMNRNANTLTVAFSFCSLKDSFSRADGKNACFEKLEKYESNVVENSGVVTVPWLDDGLLSVYYAYSKIDKPEKLKNTKFTDLISKEPLHYVISSFASVK